MNHVIYFFNTVKGSIFPVFQGQEKRKRKQWQKPNQPTTQSSGNIKGKAKSRNHVETTHCTSQMLCIAVNMAEIRS